MTCPRCDGHLETYSLGGSEALVCTECGYVGLPTDHSRDPVERESWEDALRRFRASDPETAETLDLDGTEIRVPRELAAVIERRTEKQRIVIAELLKEPFPAAPARSYRELAEETGVHRSYVGDIVREYGELATAVKRCQPD